MASWWALVVVNHTAFWQWSFGGGMEDNWSRQEPGDMQWAIEVANSSWKSAMGIIAQMRSPIGWSWLGKLLWPWLKAQ